MLPEITVPAASTERNHQEADEEAWYYTVPYDQAATMIKAQLPVGQPFRGVPYCRGDDAVKPRHCGLGLDYRYGRFVHLRYITQTVY